MPRLRDVPPLPGYPEPYGLLAAILLDGTKEWRDELPEELPAEAVVWQPAPGMHSIGGIMLHIISVEIGWFESVVQRRPRDPEESQLLKIEEIDVDDWHWPQPHYQPLSWYYALHDKIRARTLQGIQSWPAPDVPIDGGDVARTPRWVLGHIIQHEAYHGGQAILLHRLWQLQRQGTALPHRR